MRAELNKLSLQVSASLSDAEIFLRKIPNDDPVSFVDFVMRKIRTREYEARDIYNGKEKIGLTVYYVESFDNWREFVSVATYTGKSAPGFADFWGDAIASLARELSCKSVRFATVRHGLVKLALESGWNVTEITMRKYI